MGSSVTKYKDTMSSREIYNAMDGKDIFTPKKDKYVKSVVKSFKERSRVGIEKYGTTLDRNDVDLLGWLNHLQEELMDATLYIERLKDELK